MNLNEVKFSIIIAAWNAEATIQRAVLSITSQLNDDYEIIIVDDCSTDDTFPIISNLARVNKKISVYRNIFNFGPSKSRNFGLKKSQGRYIGFLDSDDYYSDGLFKIIDKEINENHPDVIKFSVREVYSSFCRYVTSSSFFSYNKTKIIKKIIDLETLPLYGYVANGFYNGDIIRKFSLTFREDLKFAEDFFFNVTFFNFSKSFEFINYIGYNYTKISVNSLSQRNIHNYSLLYKEKNMILYSLAKKEGCFSDNVNSLAKIFFKTVYSSGLRNLRNKRLVAAYQDILLLLQGPNVIELCNSFNRLNFRRKLFFAPIFVRSPFLILAICFILNAFIKIYPNFINNINKSI